MSTSPNSLVRQSMNMTPSSSTMPGGVTLEALEVAGRTVEKMLHADSQFPSLAEKLQTGGHPTVSGMQELDYPAQKPGDQAASLKYVLKRVPLRQELIEHFSQIQCNCMMGLFPQIERAWLTIDSDIYIWGFEDNSDLAYFDGMDTVILSVALLEPKKNVFHPRIKYLLCLTTAVEIVLLGVSFENAEGGEIGEMHLLPEPLFSLPTDSTFIISVAGSSKSGRIFLGGKDGNLYEFAYKADNGWFGKRATKINHSTSALSFLVPNFINAALYEEDAIEQIIVDDSRNILFTRSEKGEIQVFDLGHDGLQMTRVVALSQTVIVQEASRIATNVDHSNFAPIIGISSLPMSESAQLSLVAVSSNGVRYYFSTSNATSTTDPGRPQGLALQHIRLPPGFSATSPVPKPSNVRMSYYEKGSLLLRSSQINDSDMVWLLSSDSFMFHNILMESQCTINVDGKIWAMDEIPQSQNLMRLYKESFGSQDPPLAVIQQSQTPRKFVLISSQGTHILSKLRPVDHLRQLLIDSSGPDSDVIKAYFRSHLDIQAAANCLLLACSQSLQDSQVSQWATTAFFLYGGEPKLVFPNQSEAQKQSQFGFPSPMPQGSPFSSSSFHPHLASTPGPKPPPLSQYESLQGISTPTSGVQSILNGTTNPEMHFSAKHNALYLYFSRLIRPVWSATLVVPGNKDSPMNSTVSGNEIEWIITHLRDLKCFLEKNSQFAANITKNQLNSGGSFEPGSENLSSIQQKSVQEALLRERQSLMFLQHLVVHSLQVMGLWKVVNDHNFHAIASYLSLDDQNILRGMYFRNLVISATGRDLCNRLVQSVIQQYLNDNASTDAISNRMREVCPSLYHSEDAISSKAHEMIISARNQTDVRERNHLLTRAVTMCQEVAAHINLDMLTSHLTAVHCYDGAVKICLAAANQTDPQGLALHFYKNGEPVEDQQGMQAFINRMSCYKNILEILRKLLDTSQAHPMITNVPKSPGPPPAPDPAILPPSEAGEYAQNVLQVALSTDDNIFHVALYQWLIDQQQLGRLLGIKSPFLEDFLIQGAKKQPDSVVMVDLLWKFYEKNRNYVPAAKILSNLANKPSKEINLSQRLAYMSRAIMFVKSEEMGEESSRIQAGKFLHDLEEKMDVARIQLQIVNAVSKMKHIRSGGEDDMTQSLTRLNSELLDISSLYQNYAEPFELWECQLAILHCSGHNDLPLVQNMWTNIIEEELRMSEGKAIQTRFQLLSNKIKYLGKLYAFSQKYFPLEFIVRNLEIFSCGETDDHTVTVSSQANKDYSWVFKTILDVGISMPKILDVYNRLYMANDNIWLNRGSQNHLLHVLAKILETFADSPTIVNYNERRQFSVLCLDAIAQYLESLYPKHDSQLLVKEFKGIQAKLERL